MRKVVMRVKTEMLEMIPFTYKNEKIEKEHKNNEENKNKLEKGCYEN